VNQQTPPGVSLEELEESWKNIPFTSGG